MNGCLCHCEMTESSPPSAACDANVCSVPFCPPVCPACRAPSVCLCREGACSVSNAGKCPLGWQVLQQHHLWCWELRWGLGSHVCPSGCGFGAMHAFCAVAGPEGLTVLRCCGLACRWLVHRSRAGLQVAAPAPRCGCARLCLSLLEASAACASGMPGLRSEEKPQSPPLRSSVWGLSSLLLPDVLSLVSTWLVGTAV